MEHLFLTEAELEEYRYLDVELTASAMPSMDQIQRYEELRKKISDKAYEILGTWTISVHTEEQIS